MLRPFLPLPRALLVVSLAALAGCTGGLSCGSCATTYDFPQTSAAVPNGAQFVDDGMRMRMTQSALDFLRDNLATLLVSQFPTRPGDPNTIVIELPATTLVSGNPAVTLGQGPEETSPTKVLLDVNDFANKLTIEFDDGSNGIRVGAREIPFGLEARVFSEVDILGLANANAACDVRGTACPDNDPNCGIVGALSFQMLVIPDVGTGAACDSGTGECLKLNVQLETVDLAGRDCGATSCTVSGNIGASSLDISQPPHDANGCSPGPAGCSPTCSDTTAIVDSDGNRECATLCGTADFLSNVVLAVGGVLEGLLDQFMPNLLQGVVRGALSDVDGAPISFGSRVGLAALAPGVLPSTALDLGIAIAPTGNAFDVNNPANNADALGMDLILKSGFEAAPLLVDDGSTTVPHPCARPILGPEFASLYGGPQFDVATAQPMSGVFNGQVYHLGASIADAALNQAFFATYNSGALCLELSSDSVQTLTDGAFNLSAGTLDLLTQGKLKQFADPAAPAIVAVVPSQPPVIRYGAGTIDEGHIIVTWPKVEVGFYVLMYERFARVFAVSTDISLQLSVFPDPTTETLKIAVIDGPNAENFQENYNELLPGVDFREILESLIGVAFDAALGDGLEFNYNVGTALSDALGIPVFVDFTGLETAPASNREFLNVYLTLTNTPPQAQTATTRGLRLSSEPGVLQRAEAEDLGAGMQVRPTGRVALDVDDDGTQEFFARVDFGAWRGPLRTGGDGRLVVRDAKLSLVGLHDVEVRARDIGVPTSLEREPQRVSVWVDAQAPRVTLARDGEMLRASATDDASHDGQLTFAWQLDDGAWSEFSSSPTTSLDGLQARRVVVKARDAAGNESRPSSINVDEVRRRMNDERLASSAASGIGCAGVRVGDASTTALALLGLLVVRRRRRG